jgi:hypothetical protein
MSGLVHLHQIPVSLLFQRSFRSTHGLHRGICLSWSIVREYLPGCHRSSYFNSYKAKLYAVFASEEHEEAFLNHVYDELGVYVDENYAYKRAWAMVKNVLEIGINTPVTIVPMTAAPTTVSFLASNTSLRWLAHRGPWPRVGFHHIVGEEHGLRTPWTESLIMDLTYSLLLILISHCLSSGYIRAVTAARLNRNLEDLRVIWAGLYDDLRYHHLGDPLVIDVNMVYFQNNEMNVGLE